MFIKFVYVITAGSRMANPVFYFADDSMDANNFDAQECHCLSVETALGSSAWITFSKTRCWNIAGYEWFMNMILLPLIQRTRSLYQLLNVDGEPGEIKVYERPSMSEAYSEHNSDILRPSGSTTDIS